MRIMWCSNAPWVGTGYGVQTALFAPRLQSQLGHAVALHCFYGAEGGVLRYGDIPVYPKGYDPYGRDTLPQHAAHFGADLIITLIDAWVMKPETYPAHIRYCPWFPIDMEPIPPPVLNQVRQAFAPIVFSKFGQEMCRQAGLPCFYVPHGCDTQALKPMDRVDARKQLGWAPDAYIVGMVAANKGTPSRKSYPQCLQAFAEFSRSHDDALLYLHTTRGENGEMDGVNLPELAARLGIAAKVLFADQYRLKLGVDTVGYAQEHMNLLYNAFDVLLNPAMGEGFGVPILEAQSCGTPVITGAWTAMDELTFAGWKVDKAEATPWWTPLASFQWIPHVEAIGDRLEKSYLARGDKDIREDARAGAMAYDADLVTHNYWQPVLHEIAARLPGAASLDYLFGKAVSG